MDRLYDSGGWVYFMGTKPYTQRGRPAFERPTKTGLQFGIIVGIKMDFLPRPAGHGSDAGRMSGPGRERPQRVVLFVCSDQFLGVLWSPSRCNINVFNRAFVCHQLKCILSAFSAATRPKGSIWLLVINSTANAPLLARSPARSHVVCNVFHFHFRYSDGRREWALE